MSRRLRAALVESGAVQVRAGVLIPTYQRPLGPAGKSLLTSAPLASIFFSSAHSSPSRGGRTGQGPACTLGSAGPMHSGSVPMVNRSGQRGFTAIVTPSVLLRSGLSAAPLGSVG